MSALALHWEALLDCSGRPGFALSDTYANGERIPGTAKVGAFSSPADPLWRPQDDPKVTCPDCGGTGFEPDGAVDALDWLGIPCHRCGEEGVVPGPGRYIGEFDPSHRRNLYSWLMRRASGLLALHITTWYDSPWGDPPDDVVGQMDAWEDELARDPWGWLAARPFMLALGALLIGDGNGGTVYAWSLRHKRSDPATTRARLDGAVLRAWAANLDENKAGGLARPGGRVAS